MNIQKIINDALLACETVTELAIRCGVSRQTVHAWISGRMEPRARHLVDLIEVGDRHRRLRRKAAS